MQIRIIVIRYTCTCRCKVEHASIALVYWNMCYEAYIYSIEYISYEVHLEAYTCHLKLIYTRNRTYILFDAHTQEHAWKLIS